MSKKDQTDKTDWFSVRKNRNGLRQIANYLVKNYDMSIDLTFLSGITKVYIDGSTSHFVGTRTAFECLHNILIYKEAL